MDISNLKVYLAGSCASEHRTLMRKITATIEKFNVDLYCPFNYKVENAWSLTQEEWSEKVFQHNIEMLQNSDVVFIITFGRAASWEQGYAYALGKTIIVLQVAKGFTGLMTYNGSTEFINAENSNLFVIIKNIFYDMENDREWITGKNHCETILV